MSEYHPIGEDILVGVKAIAEHIQKTERQTHHLLTNAHLPAFKVGYHWHMRPAAYLRMIEHRESEALRRAEAAQVAA